MPSSSIRDPLAMRLNTLARRIVAELVDRAEPLGLAISSSESGTLLVDCGARVPGSDEAGIGMARAAMGGLGEVRLDPPRAIAPEVSGASGWLVPTVVVKSEYPVEACLAGQYAGWRVSQAGYFAMASGPLRACIGREELFGVLARVMGRDLRERSDEAVGLLESSKLPPDEVCRSLAADAKVAPERLVLLVARTASRAGTLQVIARSLETALHKLETLHFDLARIVRGAGRAPLAPVAADDLSAIGRTNDAILYGGEVVLDVRGDDRSIAEIGPKAVSAASPSFGRPFAELFAAAGGDFYAIDPALFAPARIEIRNLDTGAVHRFGAVSASVVGPSFGIEAAEPDGSRGP